jgi:hypothetical protein
MIQKLEGNKKARIPFVFLKSTATAAHSAKVPYDESLTDQ